MKADEDNCLMLNGILRTALHFRARFSGQILPRSEAVVILYREFEEILVVRCDGVGTNLS